MEYGRKEQRLKTKETIGGRTDGIRCRCDRTCPSARGARARPLALTRPSRTVRRHRRLWRLTHTLTQTHTTYTPHIHTHPHAIRIHTQTQTLTWHKRKRAQRNARSPTTVISYLKAFASRDGHLLFSDHSPVRLVRSLVSIPCRNNSILVARLDFDRISLFCGYSDWYYLYVAVAHITYLTVNTAYCVHFV